MRKATVKKCLSLKLATLQILHVAKDFEFSLKAFKYLQTIKEGSPKGVLLNPIQQAARSVCLPHNKPNYCAKIRKIIWNRNMISYYSI